MACAHLAAPEMLLVEGEAGQWFATMPPPPLKGYHGGRDATRTLTVVGGGHPAAPAVTRALQEQPPHLADWAPTIAAVLGLQLAGGDGRNLVTA